ncbi:MAG: hypothetical protein LUH47_09180 [Clostridiales bacterium]|nr:hypothetical protein [Clostridiales bacterium]
MAYFEDPVRSLKKKKYRLWLRGVTAMAMVVVFITTYMLILPAITLTTPTCGLEEHIHSEDCYETIYYNSSGEIISAAEAEAIINSETKSASVSPGDENASGSAAETSGTASDGTSEITSERVLTCGLEEHSHTAECYESTETTAETTSSSNSGESSSEKDSGTSDSALAAADSSEDSSADKTSETSSITALLDDVTSGGALTAETLMIALVGNSTPDLYLTVTDSSDNEYTNVADSGYQYVYEFSGSYYILVPETASEESAVTDYIKDYYYDDCYGSVFFDVYFQEVTKDASGSYTYEDASGSTELYAFVDGSKKTLSELLGTSASISLKTEYEITDSSTDAVHQMYPVFISTDDTSNTDSYNSAALKSVMYNDSTPPDGVKYAVFSTTTDYFTQTDTLCCYALAKLFTGYIGDVSIYASGDTNPDFETGTYPFDSDDDAGDDSADNNALVRSFDTINYKTHVNLDQRQIGQYSQVNADYAKADAGNMIITVEMDKSLTEARYNYNVKASDISSTMNWLADANSWYIEYLYDDGTDETVLMYEDSSGQYTDSTKGTQTSVNALVYGSEGSDTDSKDAYGNTVYNSAKAYKYKDTDKNVNCQRLVANVPVEKITPEDITKFAGTIEVPVGIFVMASKNGTEFTPTVTAYLENNPCNLGSDDLVAEGNTDNLFNYTSDYEKKNVKTMGISNDTGDSVTDEVVTVSAKASYAVEIGRNPQLSYLGNFDLSTGKEVSSITSKSTQLHGRMLGYGVTLQLYGDGTSETVDGTTYYKGIKGLELPIGDVSLYVNFALSGDIDGATLPTSNSLTGSSLTSVGSVNLGSSEEVIYGSSNETVETDEETADAEEVVGETDETEDTGEENTAEETETAEENSVATVVYSAAVNETGSETAAAAITTIISTAVIDVTSDIPTASIVSADLSSTTKVWNYTDDTNDIGATNNFSAWDKADDYPLTYDSLSLTKAVKVEGDSNSLYFEAESDGEMTLILYSTNSSPSVKITPTKDGTAGTTETASLTKNEDLIPSGSTQTYSAPYSLTYSLTAGTTYTITKGSTNTYLYYIKVVYSDSSGDTTTTEATSETTTTASSETTTKAESSSETTTAAESSTEATTVDTAYIYIVTEAYAETTSEHEDLEIEVAAGKSGNITYSDGNTIFSGVITGKNSIKLNDVTTTATAVIPGVGTYILSYRTVSIGTSDKITITVPSGVTNATYYICAQSTGGTARTLTLSYTDSNDKDYTQTNSTGTTSTGFQLLTFTGLVGGETYTLETDGNYYYSMMALVTSYSETQATGFILQEDTEYYLTPLLWDYRVNANNTDVDDATGIVPGKWSRNVDWDNGLGRTAHGRNAAPYNSSTTNASPDPNPAYTGSGTKECYYGGNWFVPEEEPTKNASTTYKVTSVDGYVTDPTDYTDLTTSYPVTVNCYTFDFDTYHFPTQYGGTGSNSNYNVTLFSFSAGYFEVLVPFPENTDASTTLLTLTATVTDAALTSESSSSAGAESASKVENAGTVNIDYEVKPLKYVSFMNRDSNDHEEISDYDYDYPLDSKGNYVNIDYTTTKENFLGDTWGTALKDHNASAVVGDTVDLWGGVMAQQNSDYSLTAVNILQIFDSTAFKIKNDSSDFVEPGYAAVKSAYVDTQDAFGEDITGEITFLYVADTDTDYQNGYNSNNSTHLEHMKSLREDTSTLVYYTTLDALEGDGYTCIGVLMEVRGAYITRGNYTAMRIPLEIQSTESVTSSGGTGSSTDKTANNVYCSVNQLKTWSFVSGVPQECQPMYGITRYKLAAANGGSYANSTGSYTTETTVGGTSVTWSDTVSSGTSSVKTANVTYTDSGNSVTKTIAYFCDGEYTLTKEKDSSTDGDSYYPTLYTNKYTDTYAGIESSSSDGSYYHNLKSDYSNTDSSPYRRGMSLLVTGYESTLSISATKNNWNMTNGETPQFTLSGVRAAKAQSTYASGTSFKITVSIDDNYLSFLNDDDGNTVVGNVTIGTAATGGIYEISADSANRTSYTFTASDGNTYTMTLYAVIADKKLTIYISGAPVGVELPDITLTTRITDSASNGSSSSLTATISGEEDLRFYSTAYTTSLVNEGTASIAITGVASTSYNKYVGSSGAASLTTMEVNEKDELVYRISYKSSTKLACLNVFDISPYKGDIPGTNMTSDEWKDKRLTISSVKAIYKPTSGSSTSVPLILYATTASPDKSADTALYEATQYYGSSTGISYIGTAFGIPNPTSTTLASVSYSRGRVGIVNDTSGITIPTSAVTLTDYDNTTATVSSSNSLTAICALIGYDSNYNDTSGSGIDYYSGLTYTSTSTDDLWAIPDGGGTVELVITYAAPTENGSTPTLTGGDEFKNVAYIKTATLGTDTANFNQTSTASYGVASRTIKGKAFIDTNKDGIYTDGTDKLLSGVSVALYKKDSSGTTYTQVTESLMGEDLRDITTDDDTNGTEGEYCFDYLEDGDYIVVFSGTSISGYEITSLRSGSDTKNDNDAVATADLTST